WYSPYTRAATPAASHHTPGRTAAGPELPAAVLRPGLRQGGPRPAQAHAAQAASYCLCLVFVWRLASTGLVAWEFGLCAEPCGVSTVGAHDPELLLVPGLGVLGRRASAVDPRGDARARRRRPALRRRSGRAAPGGGGEPVAA